MRQRLVRFVALLSVCLHVGFSVAQPKRRIAISIADPVPASPYGVAMGGDTNALKADLEEKVVDALISRLSTDPSLVLLDRQKIREILQEQNNKFDERFDSASGVKLGKLLGADVLVFVRVESYAAKESKQASNKFAYMEVDTVGDVNLTVTARALGVETESVLTSPTSAITKHEILQKSKQVGTNVPASVYIPPQMEQNDPALLTLRDASIADAAQELADKLRAPLGSVTIRAVVPKVVGIDEGKVMLNKGGSSGIKVGDVFRVTRMSDSGFKDPDTGQPIIRKKEVCTLTISSVEDSIALGDCPGAVPLAGDIAESAGAK